jgi:hypothetical protein
MSYSGSQMSLVMVACCLSAFLHYLNISTALWITLRLYYVLLLVFFVSGLLLTVVVIKIMVSTPSSFMLESDVRNPKVLIRMERKTPSLNEQNEKTEE